MCGTSLAQQAAAASGPIEDNRAGRGSLNPGGPLPVQVGLAANGSLGGQVPSVLPRATGGLAPAISTAPVHSVGPAANQPSFPPAQYARDTTEWPVSSRTMDSAPPRAAEGLRVPRPVAVEPTTQALRGVNGLPARQAVPQDVRCWRCGSPSGPGAAFCQACGAPLRENPQPAPMVAPAPPARLIVIAQDGSAGQEYPVVGGQIEIGRESGDVRISADGYACPRHARLTWKNGSFWVTDLGSVNGVFVRLTGPERLQQGDVILLGMGVLRFEVVPANETALSPAVERGTRLFGSPATPRYARLVERTVEGVARNVLYLTKNVVTIGRETGDFVFTDDPFMSRQHAGLERQSDGSFLIKDLGSSNGTFVAIRGERALPDGSHIRIGQHLFRLKVDGS
jgi:pSer/pThr/pTyr-binding forkhead associated (FHA) protein